MLKPSSVLGGLKCPGWGSFESLGGVLTFRCSTSNVINLQEDISTIYSRISDYYDGLNLTFKATLTKERSKVGKFDIPGEHAIFWTEYPKDDMYVIPIDGMFNEATLSIKVTGVKNE